MTNKKEHKILRKTLSLALTMLVSILGLPLVEPQQVSATETSDAKYLSSITMDATASSSWDSKYSSATYDKIINGYDGYTSSSPLVIKTAEELAAFAGAVNVGGKDFSGKYVKIDENVTNINLGGTNPTVTKTTSGDKFSLNITGTASNVWVPIGIKYSTPFKGNFDGGNCEISNMTVLVSYTSGDAYAGLFGRVEGASIKNTGVTGNVYASSSSSSVKAGGLVGESGNRNSITNSYSTGDVYASSSSSYSSVYAGGLVGYNYSSISASYATGNVYASSSSSSSRAGGLVGYSSSSITNGYYYSGATIDVGTAGAKSSYGTGRTIEEITGTGSGRADNTMTGLDASNWTFQDDGNGVKYLPHVKVITYNETTNPAPRFISPFTASDFDFKVSANLTYDGEPKKAEVTARSEGIGEITVKYYNSAGTNLTSAPTNAGTYTVKIEFVEGDNDVVWRNITADDWTFTIAKADPTIKSIATSVTYKTGLTLKDVPYPSTTGNTAGSWTWSSSNTAISSAGTHKFPAKYTPSSTNYNSVVKDIQITITKDTPTADDFNFVPPSNLEYSADYKIATITRKPGVEGIGEPIIKYFTKVNGELTPLEDSSGKLLIPTDVGTYYVGIDVIEDTNYNSAKGLTSDNWNFTITPAGKHTYQLADGSRIYLVAK